MYNILSQNLKLPSLNICKNLLWRWGAGSLLLNGSS